MLYTIYNVQFVICNPSVSCVNILESMSVIIHFLQFWINSIHFYFRTNKSKCYEEYFSFKSSLYFWGPYTNMLFFLQILTPILLMHEFLTWKRAPCKVTFLCHVLNFLFHSKESFPIESSTRSSVLYVRLRWNRSSLKDINNTNHK